MKSCPAAKRGAISFLCKQPLNQEQNKPQTLNHVKFLHFIWNKFVPFSEKH